MPINENTDENLMTYAVYSTLGFITGDTLKTSSLGYRSSSFMLAEGMYCNSSIIRRGSNELVERPRSKST